MELWQKFSANARKAVLIAHEGCYGRHISSARLALGLIDLGEGKAYQRLAALPDLPGLVFGLKGLVEQPSLERVFGDWSGLLDEPIRWVRDQVLLQLLPIQRRINALTFPNLVDEFQHLLVFEKTYREEHTNVLRCQSEVRIKAIHDSSLV